jgi:sialate O-acetylesterase
MSTFTPFPYPLPTWKALLQPMAAGYNYTVTAVCTGCNATEPVSITNVAFGDVWFCSGQSNMLLPVTFSFTRNETANNISANNAYSNLRVMAGSSGNYPYKNWPPAYARAVTQPDGKITAASNPWMTAAQAAPAGCVETQKCPLFDIGAACWYAVQSLADMGVTVPIGVINTALGGQRIEEYMLNTTTEACTDLNSQTIPWWNGQLFGTYIYMFTDMTVKGFMWYQGSQRGRLKKGVGGPCVPSSATALPFSTPLTISLVLALSLFYVQHPLPPPFTI